MTTANTKATAIANSDREFVTGLADKMNPLLISGGKVVSRVGLCGKLAGDGNSSVYRFARISSSARITAIRVVTDAISGMTAADVGLYDTAANGGAVVSQHLFSTGQDFHAGNTSPLEQRYINLAAASAEQAVWQLLALAADPGKSYDLAITLTTAGGAAGNLAVEALIVTGEQ